MGLINKAKKKDDPDMTDADIAYSMRCLMRGEENPIKVKKTKLNFNLQPIYEYNLLQLLSRVAYLLFGTESMRNPANFITSQMLLDLIENEDIDWEEALVNYKKTGYPLMPMATKLTANKGDQIKNEKAVPVIEVSEGNQDDEESDNEDKEECDEGSSEDTDIEHYDGDDESSGNDSDDNDDNNSEVDNGSNDDDADDESDDEEINESEEEKSKKTSGKTVKTAIKLSSLYGDYLSFPYSYPGEKLKNTPANKLLVVKLQELERTISCLWLKEILGEKPNDIFDENIYCSIYFKIISQTKSWYDLSVNDTSNANMKSNASTKKPVFSRYKPNDPSLKNLEYDFFEGEIKPDGNCLYASLLEGCKKAGVLIPVHLNTVQKIRAKIKEKLVAQEDDYSDRVHSVIHTFFHDLKNIQGIPKSYKKQLQKNKQDSDKYILTQGYDDYCDAILDSEMWGTELELAVAAELLQVRVVVYKDTPTNHFFTMLRGKETMLIGYVNEYNHQAKTLIYLVNVDVNTHFNVLLGKQPEPAPEDASKKSKKAK